MLVRGLACRDDRWGRRRSRSRGVSAARGRLGRGSGRRRLFWGSVQSLHGAEGVGDRDEGDVVVPARPGPALEVGQTEGLFHLTIVVLDARQRSFAVRTRTGSGVVAGMLESQNCTGSSWSAGHSASSQRTGSSAVVVAWRISRPAGLIRRATKREVNAFRPAAAAARPRSFPPLHRPCGRFASRDDQVLHPLCRLGVGRQPLPR